jgi:hypothetical protein
MCTVRIEWQVNGRSKGARMKKILVASVAAALLGGCYIAVTPAGVVVDPTPSLAYIPGTPIQMVSGYDNVFYYGGYYWRCLNGMWYRSHAWNGGWAVYHSVPAAFLSIPQHHPAFHVVRYHPQYRPTVHTPAIVPHTPPKTEIAPPAHAPGKGFAPPAHPGKGGVITPAKDKKDKD